MPCCGCWGGRGGGWGWTVSRPSSEDEEDEEDMEEDEEEQGGGEVGGHWELWFGTADWELWARKEEETNSVKEEDWFVYWFSRLLRLTWEGIWALVELGPLPCMPIPFSVRNSSRSMYWSWNKPPSQGRVLSHSMGPRKADWELERSALEPTPPPMVAGPPPFTPAESPSESRGLSLSGGRDQFIQLVFPHTFHQ